MNLLRSKAVKIIIALIIVSALDFYFGQYFNKYLEKAIGFYRPVINEILPCSQPIDYSIGRLDKRFGIAEDEFLNDLVTAEAILEKPTGKNFFNFTADGALKINLVYDYRQKSTEELKKMGIVINDSQEAYDKIKAKYDSLINKYDAKKAGLEKMIKDFNAAKSAYEEKVDFWNKKGGAPAGEFGKLEFQRTSLNNQAKNINAEQDAMQAIADEINAVVNVMNRLAKELNLRVDTYNTIGAGAGEEFQEGEYVRDAQGERITIYQFDSKNKLVRVLAHELGHALGLEHNDNPDSIMYRLNEGMNEKLSEADIKDVKNLCRIK